MEYLSVEDFRDAIVSYLVQEKHLCEADLEALSDMPIEEKVDKGYAIANAVILDFMGSQYNFSCSDNYTKFRPGDYVIIKEQVWEKSFEAKVIENTTDSICLECVAELNIASTYDIEATNRVMLDPMIKLASSIESATPGAAFLKILAELAMPREKSLLGSFKPLLSDIPSRMNAVQKKAIERTCLRPQIYCIQGPPGTGKTDVLANIANIFSRKGSRVAVISNTHQAVNNALNKIISVNEKLKVFKCGEELKAAELDSRIWKGAFTEYLTRKGSTKGDIVGMTLHAAIFHLGLRNTSFQPSIILVDEASQMPLTQAALIGTSGAGSIIFIGDDKQMPPIFHQKLEGHPLSVSIFSYLSNLYPTLKDRLNITYRMNKEITKVVSEHFYESDGDPLVSADVARDRRLSLDCNSSNPDVVRLLSSEDSILFFNPTREDDFTCEDSNAYEAKFAAELVRSAVDAGLEVSKLAVITPYRHQVLLIREEVITALGNTSDIPLIDTVERLQGQDVDLIILSFSISSLQYFRANRSFIFEPNRLNVMISRAKKKVIILGSKVVLNKLNL